jgi:flagellar FliL protein
MAVDIVDQEQTPDQEQENKGGKKALLFALIGLLLVAGGAAAFFFIGGTDGAAEDTVAEESASDAETKPAKSADTRQAHYFSLDPAFVVNFQEQEHRGRARFLQVTIDAMTRDEAVLDAIKTHMPVIRNNLVLLLSRQTYEELVPHEGKERLRAEALAEIQSVLQEQIGKPGVEAVYFTSFVMQ